MKSYKASVAATFVLTQSYLKILIIIFISNRTSFGIKIVVHLRYSNSKENNKNNTHTHARTHARTHASTHARTHAHHAHHHHHHHHHDQQNHHQITTDFQDGYS